MKVQGSALDMLVIIGMSSRFFARKFLYRLFDVPRSFRNAQHMNEEGKRRAGQALSDALAARGWNAIDLADAADIPDPATVRTFLAGESWPQTRNRGRMESALGLEAGTLERIARGRKDDPPSDAHADPIEAAIEASPILSRSQKLRLRGMYVEMLEGQESSTG